MIDVLKHFFSSTAAGTKTDSAQTGGHDTRVAACALFLEMARIDESFTPAETREVVAILQKRYGLDPEHVNALMAAADRELEQSVDYWRFAERINRHYSIQEKVEIIELLWRIVYVDGRLDKYENYLMHKFANLLRLSHDQLIGAKLKVLNALRT
jgi:uncharacterized tellurite resistance protein B-like protein